MTFYINERTQFIPLRRYAFKKPMVSIKKLSDQATDMLLKVIIFFTFFTNSYGKIKVCEEKQYSKVCKTDTTYNKSDPPEPLPIVTNITINFKEIADVDLEKQTITLSLMIVLEWFDYRITLLPSENDIKT